MGIGWAILERFAEYSGNEFVYLSMPVRRLQMEMLKGNIDFVFPDNPEWYNTITDAEDKAFSLPLVQTLAATLVKGENLGKGSTSIKRLALPLGFTPVRWQQKIDNHEVEIVTVSDTYSGLTMLQNDRVDAIRIGYHVSAHFSRRYPQLGPFKVDVTLPHNEVAFQLSTMHNPKLIAEFNQFILTHNALIESLYKQYEIEYPSVLIEKFRQQQQVTNEDVWKAH